jgi:thiol-disulfide isomerase/thioredoxin
MSVRLCAFAFVAWVARAAGPPAAVLPPRPSAEPAQAPQVCDAKAKSAKFNLTLKDLSGVKVKLEAFKGKVIVLNFWATWCAPCKVEIPGFVEPAGALRERSLAADRNLRRRYRGQAEAVRRRTEDELSGAAGSRAHRDPRRVLEGRDAADDHSHHARRDDL